MEQEMSTNSDGKSEHFNNFESDNAKSSITCSNVPEGLFDTSAAKKHFSKFGRVHKIRLLPKKLMCIVEYEQPNSVQRALLNAGAYDGFMFDVTRSKARIRRRSKKDDDPDWVPDSDVEEELSAMGGIATYRVPRQKPMELDSPKKIVSPKIPKPVKKVMKIRGDVPVRPKVKGVLFQPTSGMESPVIVSTNTSLSTTEAAAELHQLRSRISLTPDEKWRTLDARDRILRSWGGAGSRVKMGGATIGTCPDMCPEKELLHRQAEHQVMTLETIVDSDGLLEPWRAVKQYSRSSADQEMPMCYELRPARVLMSTCAYLLHEIADTTRQVSLADWFHFMWDRLRSIRKDITQQALCCSDSIRLVEMCARFHAHCAARLADLEHTQFDQKLNTDNLTKCLQTLKHMYADVQPEFKPKEAEFRGYIALLNLGDANFWWEIKQLPTEIQKSEAIIFAIKIFTALDNNNYVRFFRLVRDEATYLQACILLRYFNDVRARALARIVKAYAPRGGSKYPAEELMNSLAFETVESMRSFVNHYGLRFSKNDTELTVILDRNQFIEDSDPYPLARALHLIESKRKSTVAEIISGGDLPYFNYKNHTLHTSFDMDGKLKESSLIAEDLGYNTLNDTNKEVKSLKSEVQRLGRGGKTFNVIDRPADTGKSSFVKPAAMTPPKSVKIPVHSTNGDKSFFFQPAVPINLPDSIKKSPVLTGDTKKQFMFSPPQQSQPDSFVQKSGPTKNLFADKFSSSNKLFGNDNKKDLFKSSTAGSVFGPDPRVEAEKKTHELPSKSLFSNAASGNIFAKRDEPNNIFSNAQNKNIFNKPTEASNVFGKISTEDQKLNAASVFRSFTKPQELVSNGETGHVSPGTLFKQANNPLSLQNKLPLNQSNLDRSSMPSNLFGLIKPSQPVDIYEFNEDSNSYSTENSEKLEKERLMKEEAIRIEKEKELEEIRKRELERKAEELEQQEVRRKQEELKRLEEIRKKEEDRKQELLKKKLEEERQAEFKRKAEEEEKLFKERVDKESSSVIEELVKEVNSEIVSCIMKEEMEKFNNIIATTEQMSDEILQEIIDTTCRVELKAEMFLTQRLMKKWFYIWRKQILRNFKRRRLLEDTPVWLPNKTPLEEAQSLRRLSEKAALSRMNAFHRGQNFNGQPREIPPPKRYNLVEVIRSSLLKRMKQINYPCNKCFFWKLTIVSPGSMKWFCRKINIETWLLHAFRDEGNEAKENLIHVGKQSWNNLMEFSTATALVNNDKPEISPTAVEGTNGIIYYMCQDDLNIENIEKVLRHKPAFHIVPIAIITTPITNAIIQNNLEKRLAELVKGQVISEYRILIVEPTNLAMSLDNLTKTASKWLARRCPEPPPLEMDTLKSICQRYLGSDIWHRLKSDNDRRVLDVLTDIKKLVQYYNIAVEKLTSVITDEKLFNYTAFPDEFKKYLDFSVPCPKPYEYISNTLRNTENTNAIKDIMQRLKLHSPRFLISPNSELDMQDQVQQYCHQIGWFRNPEGLECTTVSCLPNNIVYDTTPSDSFVKFFEQYNLSEILNIIVYEKISILKDFSERFAIYHKSVMEDFRNVNWLYDIDIISSIKHKADVTEDDLDYFIEAKRRKIDDSCEYLALEDADCTRVECTLASVDRSISMCNSYKKVVSELETQLDEGKKKSDQLERLLQAALNDA
ncbi:unnamed protein product [Leptosia nina]|uniref:Protein xmas-2 n=1 Tax=Leptosia nina TaxID=320188 RepID=A0AAV1JSY5_9NEOP